MDVEAIRAGRMAAQLLAEPVKGQVVDVVRRLPAVQAQDPAAYPLAVRARSAGLTAADVTAALEAREVVRCWGPRGTLHLVAAEDLRWLFPLVRTGPAGSVRRLKQLGVETAPEQAAWLTERALAGQGPLTKPELGERLAGLGLPAQGQAIVHLAALAAREGLVVLGPERAGKPTYVHAADWLGAPLPTEPPDGALRELVVRYRRAHDPAEPADLAAWSGLGLRDLTTAWGQAPPSGRAHDAAPVRGTAGRRAAADPSHDTGGAGEAVRLIPAYDEYLLGWKSRDLAVPEPYRRRIHPGGGVLKAAVLVGALVRGTWRMPKTGVAVEPYEPLPDLTAEIADIERFCGSNP
jgi:hypothetical protein